MYAKHTLSQLSYVKPERRDLNPQLWCWRPLFYLKTTLFNIKTETVGLEPTSHALKRQRSTIKLCQNFQKEGGEIRTLDM
jgi:hypothetical protein